ncbi:cyclin-L1-1 [Mercurialis annua]|uniref:cyclin-L1-1 n=1 Tax=Mercurialis annua TaxID=3986 RepID=UPI00215F8652|nr:cyclin-L1-1 [Mercurialis annua]
MIYTAIDNFYLTDEQLQNSPSRKDGIDEATETTLRIYGCDLIQESGILLKLPQAVMATGQVLFHRFYCKKSFARFNVKKVAASCVWLACKLEENPRKSRQVIIVFHRMECRRENLPIEFLDLNSKKFAELKVELSKTERHILKEMGFICHVEHPHKFISNYLATLETPPELRQEAWNLANDSLRTALCVRFKSEVVACGVVYAAARRFHVPLPENPPWWKAFDADKYGIDEVCRVLAHLYSLPKAKYLSVCKDGDFSFSSKSSDCQTTPKEVPQVNSPANDALAPKTGSIGVNAESGGSKAPVVKAALDKLKDSVKSGDESKPADGDARDEPIPRSKSEHRAESNLDRSKERDMDRERERDRERYRIKGHDRERGRDSERERDREDSERDRERAKDRGRRSKDRKDSGHSNKSRYHSSRDQDHHSSSYSSREKDRNRHHSQA